MFSILSSFVEKKYVHDNDRSAFKLFGSLKNSKDVGIKDQSSDM